MKSIEEDKHYRNLKRKMIAKCDAKNIKWATYYANLLGIGGANPEIAFRNYFNDTNKRFNAEQLSVIYNDLEDHSAIEPFTQCEIQGEVLRAVARIGRISQKMEKHFDDKDEIISEEILPLLPEARELFSITSLLYLRIEETKAQL